MSIRSRALLTGVATGFLKANNDRRDRMSERMQALADNRATMERERAKSRYDAAAKGAAEEANTFNALRSAGHIDDDGLYTDVYWKDKTLADWRENGNGLTHEKFINTYKQGRGEKFVRQFKDMSSIQQDIEQVYNSIDAKHADEVNRPVLTGLERMLGRATVAGQHAVAKGFNKVTSTLGVDAKMQEVDPSVIGEGASEDTSEVSSVASFDPMAAPEAIKTYADTGLEYRPEPQRIQQIIKDQDGLNHAVFASTDGTSLTVNLGITSALGAGEGRAANRKIEKARLFDRDKNVYFEESVDRDKETGDILINGEWVQPANNIGVMPDDVSLVAIEYTDPITGEEMSAQAYQTHGSATGSHVIRMPDGTTWATTGKPVFLRGARDANDPERLPRSIGENVESFAQHRKTAGLAAVMLKQDFISNPTTWAQSNMSTFTDMIGASFGLVGENRLEDLEAIAAHIKSDAAANSTEYDQLKDKIGALDASAVISGNRDAMENFLVFALARSNFGGGKLTVQAVEMAEDVVKPLMRGSTRNIAGMQAVIDNASDEMSRIAGPDIAMAISSGPESKIWDNYYRIRDELKRRPELQLVPERTDGFKLINKIGAMEGEAKKLTIKRMQDTFGADWRTALLKPIRFDVDADTAVMPMYIDNPDGSISIGIFPIK